jgi:Protein of unknown function (DUF1403)
MQGEGGDARMPDAERQGADALPADPRFAAGAAAFAIDQVVRSDAPWLGCWRMRLTRPAAATIPARPGGCTFCCGAGRRGRCGWRRRPKPRSCGRPRALHLGAIDDAALRNGADGRRLKADAAGLEEIAPVLLLRSAVAAHAEAVALARRAAAAGLRTRDEGRGLALVLGDDSVAPWRMVGKILTDSSLGKDGMNSDRAARRFRESLHARGALRLLTGRPALRLYGL